MPKKTPERITLRTYQVGFGDAFLLGFHYAGGDDRFVLIDFGTTGLGKGRGPGYMKSVADDVKARCGGKLHAVVATHRHQDHISGFATKAEGAKTDASGDVIRSCAPRFVLQPWTEEPDLEKDALGPKETAKKGGPQGFAALLAGMQGAAAGAVEEAARLGRGRGIPFVGQIEFLGADGISNRSAVENLAAMGQAAGSKALYLHADQRPNLDLPGVKTHVLGPPTLRQSEAIREQRDEDPVEFWMLLGATGRRFGATGAAPFSSRECVPGASAPDHVRWLRDKVRAARAETLHAIVRVLDEQMNNTSLILVFEVGGARLLFPGDAQIENWNYALTVKKAKYEKLLAATTLYKVGHHGSRNATPKKGLWDRFERRSAKTDDPDRMWSIVSTMGGKHGKTEATAVPRATLVEALEGQTNFRTTQKFQKKRSPEFRDFDIDPGTGRVTELPT